MSLLSALADIIQKANQNPEKAAALLSYLVHFGYADPQGGSLSDLLNSIKRFKDIFSINEEGIGPKTLKAIEWPRCGCKDYLIEQAVNPNKWGMKDISYYIQARDSDISPAEWDAAIQRAFNSWSKVTPLRFFKVDKRSEGNFILDVGSTRADDFDGPSGVLAWCQLVPAVNYRGQILCKFDLGETWVINNPNRGILIENVGCHEFGHGLGLTHSSRKTALMAPYYSAGVPNPQEVDDIPRIQSVYGKPTSTPIPTPTPVPTPTPTPSQDLVISIGGQITSVNIPGYRITKLS